MMSEQQSGVDGGGALEYVERPFTDWGQWGYGHLDLRVFDQDVYWCDVAGRPCLIRTMSPDYRLNVLDFLGRGAAYYHLMTVRRRLIDVWADVAGARVDEEALGQIRAVLAEDAQSWLASTPLVRALKGPGRLSPPGDRSH